MPVQKVPYKLDLDLLGVVEGVSHIDNSPSVPNSNRPYPSNSKPQVLCHYFGGIPYALPPVGPFRFKRPRAIPPCYRYGTQANPGRFNGICGVCPQPTVDPAQWEEDCLQLNIWLPAGEPPKEGWPVLFFIHGGFLQWGSPNLGDASTLLGETTLNAIIVKPAYRLNVFGFLAGAELAAETAAAPDLNVGFWDQRLALEWVYKKISYFGGNPSNITISGYSAGSYSVFHQLAYDLYQPAGKQIVRRAMMFSNGPGVQPHSLSERQPQFDELLAELGIANKLSSEEKMAKLRAVPASDLVAANNRMKLHEFRATTDGKFVSSQLFENITNGDFARRMKARSVQLVIGECRDEHFVYGAWRPAKALTYQGCFDRLLADYPQKTVEVLMRLYSPGGKLPGGYKDWADAFGRIYADCQVHHMERGFIHDLDRHGAGDLVKRYRVEWRAECADAAYPIEWGVCHGSDLTIWFYGDGKGEGLSAQEKTLTSEFVLEPMGQFLAGHDIGSTWGTKSVAEVRRLKPNGEIDIWKDEMWENGLRQWEVLRSASCLGDVIDKAKL